MQQVFDVIHSRVRAGFTDRKGGGVYSTLDAAQQAIARLLTQPGFRDYPDGFSIHRCIVGTSYAPLGFDRTENVIAAEADLLLDAIASNTMLYSLYNQSTIDDIEYDNDFVLIGFFHSQTEAEHAAEVLKAMPEFNRPHREFGVSTCVVDRIEWSEGFVSVAEAMKQFR